MTWNKFLLHSGLIICLVCPVNNVKAEESKEEEYPGWEFVAPEVKEKCNSVKNSFIPDLDKLDPKELEALKGCDSDELYYGFNQAPDYKRAHQCALANIGDEEGKEGAYGILTMLYANGKGVTPSIDIAIYYACKFGGAPAELEGRVKHLMELQATGKKEKDFDICDDITSGYMMGQCASKESRFEDGKRQKEFTALMTSWSSEERKAFEKLQKAFENYLKERVNEIDFRGTIGPSLVIEEEISLKNRFLKEIKGCVQNTIPPATSSQYKGADKQLNTIYKEVRNKQFADLSGISSEGIQKTQRAWIRYRDAWAAFGRLNCPNISAESLNTLLTKERIKELRALTEMGEE